MLCRKPASPSPPSRTPAESLRTDVPAESQSRDLDDVGAGCGLDARGGGGVALGRPARPPLRGCVEAAVAATGAQGRRRREADDGRGDAAAFAVYPAAVVGFQVQAGAAAGDKTHVQAEKTSLAQNLRCMFG